MSFTRWFVYASFASGVIALSLQPSGFVNASSLPILQVADQSSSSSQDQPRELRSGKTGTANAESSGKMQSEKDALSGGKNTAPNSRFDGKSRQEQGSEVAPGPTNPGAPGSSGSSPASGISSGGGGLEKENMGPAGGSR